MTSTILGRVFVVDDEIQLMNALVEALNTQGYEAVGFQTGEAALKALQVEECDLLLTDLMMPGMDGIKLLRASMMIDKNLVGILMTGQGTVPTAIEAMRAGAFDYILKPFRLDTVLPVLTRAMEVRRLRLENIQLRETVAIYNLSQAIAFSQDSKVVLEHTVDAALQQTDSDEASIMLLSPESEELYIAAAHGKNRDRLLGQRIPLREGIAGWVARKSEPLILNGEVRDSRFTSLWPRGEIRSAISMPMLTGGKLVGVMNINSLQSRRPFTTGQVKALSILTSAAAAALENEAREKRFRALIENAPDGIALLGMDGKLRQVTPSTLRILGYSLEESQSQEPSLLTHPDDLPTVLSQLNDVIQNPNKVIRTEYRFKHKDGTWRWLESTISNLIDEPGVEAIVFNYRDITERKQSEEALRESETRYRLATRATNDVIWEWTSETKQLTWSENAQHVLGYSPEEISDETWWDNHIHPEDRQRVVSKMDEVIAGTETIWSSEYRFLLKDGSYAYVSDHGYVERDTNGHAIRMIGAMANITERKQAEKELETVYDQLKNLFDNLDEVFFSMDTIHWKVLQMSPACEKVYGWPQSAFFENAQLWSEVVHPDDMHIINGNYSKLYAGESVFQEYRIYRLDGEIRWLEAKLKPTLDSEGKLIRIDGVSSDITERKRVEQALREREQEFRSLFEDSPVSLWVEDLSELKQRLNQLKKNDVRDFSVYFREHPDIVSECADLIRVLDVNSAAVKLYHAKNKTELIGKLTDVLPTIPVEQFARELIPLASGQLDFEREGVDETLTGERIYVNIRWTVAPGYEDTLGRVLVSTVDITSRKRAEEQAQLQIQRLKSLHAIDLAISSSFNLNLTLDILLNQVITQLNVDAAAVLLLQPVTRTLINGAGLGFRTPDTRAARVKLGEGYAGKAVLERRMIHVRNLMVTQDELPAAFLLMLKEECFVDYYCVPLIVKGEVKGVLEIFHRSTLESDPEWLDFLETLAGQAAIAIEDATLFENLQRSNQELFQAYDATIEGWSHALDLRDKETEGHTQRVTDLTMELARKFGFSEEQLINLRWGALLHDIGKMGVPDSILLKPGKLTDEEWEMMRQHPTFAFEMLSPIAYLKSSLDIPYCHHEKWDGSGYPRGLKGEVIPLAARLFAVVDVWDALRSDRPYRKGWTVEETVEYIRGQSGTHFDPKVVEYFLNMMEHSIG